MARCGLVVAVALLGLFVVDPASAAVALTVTTTADVPANSGACGSASTTVPSPLSLREATCIANNYGNTQPVTINVPSGTYTLSSGELALGKASGSNITVIGAGAGTTFINGNHASRVLDLDPSIVGGVDVSISGVTVTNGRDDTYGGAGIIAGSGNQANVDTLSVTNVSLANNEANFNVPTASNKPGGGLLFQGGKLTLTNVTVTGNKSFSSAGSGVYYQAVGSASPQSLTVTGSTFTNNTTANSGLSGTSGGALALDSGSSPANYTVSSSRFTGNSSSSSSAESAAGAAIFELTGNLTVTGSTFTGNAVSGTGATGGPILYTAGTAALHDNRMVGNTGFGGVMTNSGSGSVDATDNWWGCNAGPNSAGCETTSGTNITAAPRLVLVATASPSHVVGPNGTATVTASLLTDSAGNPVPAANLVAAFNGLPVSFSDPPGDATVTLAAGAHTANLSNGTAGLDYHSNSVVGPDNDLVTLDNATVTAVLEVDIAPSITSANAAHFDVGVAGSFTVTTTGYPVAAITKTGTPPAGLTFVDNGNGTATLSGTPTGAGTYSLNLTANNGVAPNATQTLTVSVGQPPAFTSPGTATFVVGTAGSFTVTTSGAPTVSTVTESGTLPPGVTFTDNGDGTATISGTPTGTGNTYPVTLAASNGVTPNASQSLTIQVNQAPQVTQNPAGQTVQPGTPVTFTAAAAGTPTPTVRWQRSTDGGASFTNIAGATSTSYTFTPVAGDNGNEYRAVFTNAVSSATTTAATLAVGTAPAFTSADHTALVVGQAGSFSISTSGLPSATLSRTGAQFPAWLTLTDNGDGTGTLTGTPPAGAAGQYMFTLKAANGFSPAASQTFTLFVDDSPVITSADHATFTAGTAGSFAVTTTAGFPTTTAITETGALPSGVTFTDSGNGTAILAGTPAAGTGGQYPVTIHAAASGGQTAPATQSFTLTVLAPPSFTSVDHATFSAGTARSFVVTTGAGNPASTTISKSGTLPAGLGFTDKGDGTASIHGTPDAGSGGVYTVTLTAGNGVSPDATQTFTLTVTEPPHITSADHTTFAVGTAGSFTVSSAGGEPSAVTLSKSGALPSGVTFTDNGDGTATLAGTPAAGTGGSYPVTLTASNGVLPDSTQSFTLTVTEPASITSADHTTFAVGSAGSFTVTTAGGEPSAVTLSKSGALPSGVTFTDNADGTATVAGTPAAGTGGTFSVTFTASNGVLPDSTQSFTLSVDEPASITSADHATFTAGTPGSFTVSTSGGFPSPPGLSKSGALPSGVTFTDNADGTATLAGTPAAGTGGTFSVTFTASNGVLPDATQSFTLTVGEGASITSADHTLFAVGSAGSFTVTTAGGFPSPPALSKSGALPSGVTFTDNGDGTATLAGTPAAGTGGSYPVTVTAGNGVPPDSTQSFTLTVTDLPVITSADHATFAVGAAGSFTVQTSSGFPTATSLTESGPLPAGVGFTDNGDGTATLAGTPHAGTANDYPLTITATNTAGHRDQSFALTVAKQTQTITLSSAPASSPVVGDTYTPVATSDSGLPVTFTVDPATTDAACTLAGGVVSFVHAGLCVLDADQSGDGTYAAADRVSQTIQVRTVAISVAVTLAPATAVYGQPTHATATVSGGSPAGSVQFTVDGARLGSPVALSGGQATSAALVDAVGNPLEPGAHQIGATFTPSDETTYSSSTGYTTEQVGQAGTTTSVAVHAHTLTAGVAANAPATGTPGGTVTFSVGGHPVGSAVLQGGTATLTYTVPAGKAASAGAVYTGSTEFAPSSASTARHDPRITATVTSAHPTLHHWYRSAVRIAFHCTTNGAPLTRPCPTAVTLTRNAAGQSVSRTVRATDGGISTVSVTGIDIDTVAPTVTVTGVRNGATYGGTAPKPRCVGHDALSGVWSCTIARTTSGSTTTYRATATDRAGNSRSVTGSYRTDRIWLQGAPRSAGVYQVRTGHTYTLVVTGSGLRPVYYDAAPYPHSPTRRDMAFHAGGHHRWVLGVTMTASMHSHRLWNLGVRIGRTLHRVTVHVG